MLMSVHCLQPLQVGVVRAGERHRFQVLVRRINTGFIRLPRRHQTTEARDGEPKLTADSSDRPF
jgi:hypothetical protein